jgi:dolichol kinase
MHFWLRKIWHLLGNAIAIIYFFSSLSSKQAAFIVFVIFLCVFALDSLRIFYLPLNQWFLNHFDSIIKEQEKHSFVGTTYYFLAISLTVFFFPKDIATCAIFYMTLGDPIAAIVGHYFPFIYIWHHKTLTGSLANFFTCLGVGLCFFPFLIALLGAFVATLTEILSPIDDALSIPLCSALFLYLFV